VRRRLAVRNRAAATVAALLSFGLLAGCASRNPDYDPSKPHHRPDGFNNRFIDNFDPGQPSFWRWQWERWRHPPPPSRPDRVPVSVPDAAARAALKAPTADATVTWLGHSTVLWRVAGLNVLTDPHLTRRASPVGFAGPAREVPMPIGLDDLPRVDVVLISHNHYDHLDRGTVRALAAQAGGPPLFVVPLGVDRWMRDEGITTVQRMDWWDTHRLDAPAGDVLLHFVPAQHWSSRSPWDRSATLWGGFVLQARVAGAPLSMYYAGDTGWSADFAEIGARFGGFDFAQIPVGCYLPRWFMSAQHVNEAEAVRIHQAVRSRLSIGVHWGTFRLCDDPIEAPLDGLPAARAAAGVPADAFVLPAIGETRVLRAAAGPAR
jgi:L-ascorbate metabolism protein UlaG (beta-lactamase superfamily)